MADTRLTKVGPLRAVLFCAFALFSPTKLVEAERADEEAQKHLPQPPPPEPARAFKVTRGLWASLAWVLGSIVAGYLSGRVIDHEAAMVWTINGVTGDGAVSFDGVDVFQFDAAGLIRGVRAFWQRGSLHRQFQRLRDAESPRR